MNNIYMKYLPLTEAAAYTRITLEGSLQGYGGHKKWKKSAREPINMAPAL
jgi:hypothetical protein